MQPNHAEFSNMQIFASEKSLAMSVHYYMASA